MAKLNDRQQEFLDNPYVGVLTTIRSDGSPHSTPVWVGHRDGNLIFNTALGRAKANNLEKNPKASMLVLDPGNAYKWVAVNGSVSFVKDGADDDINAFSKKYLGQDEYPFRQPGEERVTVVVNADRVETSGFEG